MAKLKIGDTVLWSGCFGLSTKQEIVISGMELCDTPRSKYGETVSQVDWEDVEANLVVFDLENGSWAYSEQISKI